MGSQNPGRVVIWRSQNPAMQVQDPYRRVQRFSRQKVDFWKLAKHGIIMIPSGKARWATKNTLLLSIIINRDPYDGLL